MALVQVLQCNVFSGSVPDLPAARAAMAVQWLAELSKTPKCAVALHARIFALPTSVLPTCFFRAAGEAKGPSCVQPAPSACSSAIRSTPPSPSPPHSPLPPLLFFCFNCSDCDKPVDSLNICVTADSAVCSHMLQQEMRSGGPPRGAGQRDAGQVVVAKAAALQRSVSRFYKQQKMD
jgi:hypothetical protein